MWSNTDELANVLSVSGEHSEMGGLVERDKCVPWASKYGGFESTMHRYRRWRGRQVRASTYVRTWIE